MEIAQDAESLTSIATTALVFHSNGSIAASGNYDRRNEVGTWKYWNADGQPEK